MKKEKIKRYKKSELLELLIRLRTENDELRAELEECKSKLEDKRIAIEHAGSIADAAMELSGIFEAAQAACDQYMENLAARAQTAGAEQENVPENGTGGLFDELLEWRAGQAGQET